MIDRKAGERKHLIAEEYLGAGWYRRVDRGNGPGQLRRRGTAGPSTSRHRYRWSRSEAVQVSELNNTQLTDLFTLELRPGTTGRTAPGCGAGGDIIEYVSRYSGHSFVEAVQSPATRPSRPLSTSMIIPEMSL